MNIFKRYMKDASHYLFPKGTPEDVERQRNHFITYCEKYGLDKDFEKLVAENPQWAELAQEKPVFFFEDVYRGSCGKVHLPQISMFGAENNTVPVVKILISSRCEYFED